MSAVVRTPHVVARLARAVFLAALAPAAIAGCSSLLDFRDGTLDPCHSPAPPALCGNGISVVDSGVLPVTDAHDEGQLDAAPIDSATSTVDAAGSTDAMDAASTDAAEASTGDGGAEADAGDPCALDPLSCGRCPAICDGSACDSTSYQVDRVPFTGSEQGDIGGVDANLLYAIPVTIGYDACVTAIGYLSASRTGGETGYMGLYASDSGGNPAALIATTGQIASPNGAQEFLVPATFLPKGTYWILGVWAQVVSFEQVSSTTSQPETYAATSYPAGPLPATAPLMSVYQSTANAPLNIPTWFIRTLDK